MYTLIRTMPLRQLLLIQTPALGISFIVAELFYKFHSFTLECLAFLATWYAVDWIIEQALSRFQSAHTAPIQVFGSREAPDR